MRSSYRNPYTNRKAILCEQDFFGRDRELRDVYTRVLGGQSVSLIGERRTGKSSLLYALNFSGQRESFEIPENLRFVYGDCQELAGCDESVFIAYLCQQFANAVDLPEPAESSRAALKKLANSARREELQSVLVLDEFDVLIENPRVGPEFLAFLRSWATSTNTAIVIASREGSVERLVEDPASGSAFLNIFGTLYVGPLELRDAKELITVPAANINEPFNDEQIDCILSLGGLHPFFLQIACYHSIETNRKGITGQQASELVTSAFTYEAAPHFKYLAGRLSSAELRAIQDSREFGKNREKEGYEGLLRKGILVQTPEVRLFSSLFLNYVPQLPVSV